MFDIGSDLAVKAFPMWMAPNVITLTGFGFIVAKFELCYCDEIVVADGDLKCCHPRHPHSRPRRTRTVVAIHNVCHWTFPLSNIR